MNLTSRAHMVEFMDSALQLLLICNVIMYLTGVQILMILAGIALLSKSDRMRLPLFE
jgi:hypothetical protein